MNKRFPGNFEKTLKELLNDNTRLTALLKIALIYLPKEKIINNGSALALSLNAEEAIQESEQKYALYEITINTIIAKGEIKE